MAAQGLITLLLGFVLGVSLVIVYLHYVSRADVLRFSRTVEESRSGGAEARVRRSVFKRLNVDIPF